MTIRITGMNSNLDTDTIIQELVKASSTKKDNMVKAQTKLSWKQESWKSLNTKIYGFFNKTLYDMTMQGSYKKKSTTVADSKIATVIAGDSAVNGTQTLAVKKLAKSGYLTGGKLSEDKSVTNATTLSELTGGTIGESDTVSLKVKNAGKETEITLSGKSKISDVIKQLTNAGLGASFDADNQRIYINAKGSGTENDFSITAGNANGLQALSGMGLLTEEGTKNNPEYQAWAAMWAGTDDEIKAGADFKQKVVEVSADRASNLLASLDDSQKSINSLKEKREALLKDQAEMQTLNAEIYEGVAGDNAKDKAENITKELDRVTNQLRYLELKEKEGSTDGLTESEQTELDGIVTKAGEEGYSLSNLNKEELGKDKIAMTTCKTVLDSMAKLEDNIQSNLDSLQSAGDSMLGTIGTLVDYYGTAEAAAAMTTEERDAALTKLSEFTDGMVEMENDLPITFSADSSYDLVAKTTDDSVTQVKTAYDAINNTAISGASKTAVRVMGQDAVIVLNGAEYESSSNSFSVNGLTITANSTSAVTKDADGNEVYEETALNTSDDVDGIYNMVRDFFKEYNELIKELDTLYNADTAKGYEPLTTEEKSAMTDAEVELWEKKIKDSLLRRDSSLGTVINTMKSSMLDSYTINGKRYSLSSFGINTLGYFNAGDNEKGCYHIDGDANDSSTSKETDMLKKAIANDPDTVMDFFSQLTKSLHTDLNKQMQRSDYRSIYHVYDDKKMQEEYDNYTTEIKAQEKKLKELEDRYYNQFTAMEVALSKLNSQQSSLAGLLGSG